jgi:hypothetical protein
MTAETNRLAVIDIPGDSLFLLERLTVQKNEKRGRVSLNAVPTSFRAVANPDESYEVSNPA